MYDLEKRTLQFAITVRRKMEELSFTEANERLGGKDLIFRLKIARKEAKETRYWLKILATTNAGVDFDELIIEVQELRKILSSIILKLEDK
jgi:four helix bundle protein